MKKGFLSSYFNGIAVKRLSAAETDPETSNQHEFNGVTRLKQILGSEKRIIPADFVYLGEYEDETVFDDGFVTWYDSRENHPERSEYRLYYPTNTVMRQANPGDLLVIGQKPDNSLLVTIAQSDTTLENNIKWLFDLPDEYFGHFLVQEIKGERDKRLDFVSRIVLETLGIEITETDDNYLDLIEKKFGSGFPKTDVFSAFARATLPEISSLDNPDEAFIAWIDREEMLFRTLERRLVSERLREGFVKGDHIDVDGFVILALKIINRRKARAGLALEHHLEYIFQEHHILYSRGKTTENKSKPDFIFPNIEEYHDAAFPQSRLTMLGVKSTCKDRWRQVLTEAERIKKKHLFTLETGISLNQTKEMQSHNLQLVLPKGLHKTYKAEQIAWLLNLQDFLELVKARQTPKY